MNDYFTFFYVKHFELPMCMKCAIQINLPCLALPNNPLGEGSNASSTNNELWRVENSFLRMRRNLDAQKGAACS